MTEPRYALCRCGHTKGFHEGHELSPQCLADSCTCLTYRPAAQAVQPPRPSTAPAALRSVPATAPTAPVRPPETAAPAPTPEPETVEPAAASIAQLLELGRASTSKRIVTLADKVGGMVDELRNRLVDEERTTREQRAAAAAREKARARIVELEAQLAREKAVLKSGTATKAAKTSTAGSGGSKQLDEPVTCCGKSFTTAQGIAVHRARAAAHAQAV